MRIKHSIAAMVVLVLAVGFTACGWTSGSLEPEPPLAGQPGAEVELVWMGTWGTAQQLVEPHNNPPAPGLSGNTLRQVVRVSVGGEQLRLRLSNEFSDSPITLDAVHIAQSVTAGAIDPASDRALSFGGQPGVTIPARSAVVSDAVDFPVPPRGDLAITIYFGATPADITGHPGSRTTSYLQTGAAVSHPDLSNAITTDHWYVIDGIELLAPASAAAVVILGDSITDGRGSGTNRQNRWPDQLARRLHANLGTGQVAVLNMGIGGNCVLRGCLGPSAVSRFEGDVLDQAGVRWLIILEGINDIGGVQGDADAVVQALIAAYEDMIDQAHARGILVYGATLLPFGGSSYDSPAREAARAGVNRWIRTSGRFDAVIDFEAALRDPANPSRLLPAADTGDGLHPNETGYRLMAEAVDLKLFQ